MCRPPLGGAGLVDHRGAYQRVTEHNLRRRPGGEQTQLDRGFDPDHGIARARVTPGAYADAVEGTPQQFSAHTRVELAELAAEHRDQPIGQRHRQCQPTRPIGVER